MSETANLLILVFNDVARDPRVNRQMSALSERYALSVAGYGETPDTNIRFIELPHRRPRILAKAVIASLLLGRLFDRAYWRLPQVQAAWEELGEQPFDAILANDLYALPLALRLAGRRPVIFDAHEYAPLQYEDRTIWRLLFKPLMHHLCRRFLPKAAGAMTVCQGIADKYKVEFGARMTVVHNASRHCALNPRPTGEAIRMVHHGAAIPSRGIELMIEAMNYVEPRFSLDLMLVGSDSRYLKTLERLAQNTPGVNWVPAVAYKDIIPTIAEYDIGVYQLPPINFNSKLALPNKFFEFIQARLATVIGPSPEMAALVRRHELGVVAEDFTAPALARAINSLTSADVDQFKQNAELAAEQLSFETQAKAMLQCVADALALNRDAATSHA